MPITRITPPATSAQASSLPLKALAKRTAANAPDSSRETGAQGPPGLETRHAAVASSWPLIDRRSFDVLLHGGESLGNRGFALIEADRTPRAPTAGCVLHADRRVGVMAAIATRLKRIEVRGTTRVAKDHGAASAAANVPQQLSQAHLMGGRRVGASRSPQAQWIRAVGRTISDIGISMEG